MAQTHTVSLKPLIKPNPEEDSLSYIIGRVNEDRGHFRNITEQSLQNEIDAGDAQDDIAQQEEEPQDREARFKELHAKRMEMLTCVDQARVEVQTALDFISLLLSKERPGQVRNTMSPALQQILSGHLGSTSFDKIAPKKILSAQEQNDRKVKLGANFQTLQTSAKSLLGAAKKLEGDLKNETDYWNQVLSIKEEGWALCRMPRQRAIGVQYGFLEAGPNFKQSLAAIRTDEDGHLKLDAGARRKAHSLRVRIVDSIGVVIESSRLPKAPSANASLEEMIRQTRDSLFDEEAFYEMTREARTMLAYGVKVKDHVIHAPLPSLPYGAAAAAAAASQEGYQMLVDLVPISEQPGSNVPEGQQANATLTALRLLLSSLHHRRFVKRSSVPSPLSSTKQSPPVEPFLRPVMNVNFQLNATQGVEDVVRKTLKHIQSAGIAASCAGVTNSLDLSKLQTQADHAISGINLLERILATLTRTFKLSIASRLNLLVEISTYLGAPCFGTQYRVTRSEPDARGHKYEPAEFSDAESLYHYLTEFLIYELATVIQEAHISWTKDPEGVHLRKSVATEAGGKAIKRLKIDLSEHKLEVSVRTGSGPFKSVGVWKDGAEDGRTLSNVVAAE